MSDEREIMLIDEETIRNKIYINTGTEGNAGCRFSIF